MTKIDRNVGSGGGADYYAQGQTWSTDRAKASRRSLSTAWTIAGIAVGIAALEAIALAMLAPLKTVEQRVILVDRQTGYTQALNGDGVDQISPDQALTQSLLAQYVIGRESFDISTVARDYRKVSLWSADRARTDYMTLMQPANPESPFATLPRSTLVSTHVRSVSRLGPETAMVRFETERIDRGNSTGSTQSWAAIIHYRYVSAPMSFEDRLVNPLGFQVTRYSRDEEAPALNYSRGAEIGVAREAGPRASDKFGPPK